LKKKVDWIEATLLGVLGPLSIINLCAAYFRKLFPKNLIGFLYSESFFTSLSLLTGVAVVFVLKKNSWMFIIGGVINIMGWCFLICSKIVYV